MTKREWILAGLLASAGVLFTIGVAQFDTRAAWLVAAVLLGTWSWLVLAGEDE